VRKWCREFKDGRTDVHDEQRSGRLSVSDETIIRNVYKRIFTREQWNLNIQLNIKIVLQKQK
jgi:hypothetical protein